VTKRRIAIALGAIILVVGVVAGRERPTLELAQETSAARVEDGIDLDKLQRGEAQLPQTDPFSRKGFETERQKAAPASPPEKPTAPPLPFQYFGRLTENGKTDVYVMRGDELLAIAPGQNLGEYRVDKIDPSSISFTYLPLKTKQTLELQ
jgi:nucleoid-associated protein YgaU